MTITEFLRIRLDEDESVARVFDWATPDQYEERDLGVSDEYVTLYVSPARVLAEVEAKRAIVESETSAHAMRMTSEPGWDVTFVDGRIDAISVPGSRFVAYEGDEAERVYEAWVERNTDPVTDTPTLRLLALPFADHPDYDELATMSVVKRTEDLATSAQRTMYRARCDEHQWAGRLRDTLDEAGKDYDKHFKTHEEN